MIDMPNKDRDDVVTETAALKEDGQITVSVVASNGDTIGHGGFNLTPADPEYEDYKTRFNLKSAGDWRTIARQFIDGKWIDLPPRPEAVFPDDPSEGKLI